MQAEITATIARKIGLFIAIISVMIIMLINNTDSPKYSISVRLGSSYSIFLKRDMTIIIPHMIDRTVITKNTIGFPFWYVNNFKDSSLENLLNNSLFKFHKK